MRTSCAFLFALALTAVACSKKANVESSVSELEKVFPAAAASAPTQSQPTAPAVPAQQPQADADALVKNAVAAARANDYAGGVIALQAAQTKPGITADQVAAVQRTKQAMVAELQRRAVNGDQQALAQLRAIEKTRSQ